MEQKRKQQLKMFEREHKEKQARQMMQSYCKGTKVKVVEKTIQSRGFYKFKKTGCKNERRNGSAWCEQCSVAHHKSMV